MLLALNIHTYFIRSTFTYSHFINTLLTERSQSESRLISKTANQVPATVTVTNCTVVKRSFWLISETARASSFKLYHIVALDSLFILTRNGITYFLSAAHRIHMFILGPYSVRNFLITNGSISKRFIVLEWMIQYYFTTFY